MASELEGFANRYAEAWCSQNPESVASFYAEAGSLSVNDDAPALGRAAITEVARGFMTAFPDMVVTMDRLVRKPHCVEFHFLQLSTCLVTARACARSVPSQLAAEHNVRWTESVTTVFAD